MHKRAQLLTLGAVLAAWFAQWMVGDPALRNPGWIMYASAAGLFGILCSRLVPVPVAAGRLNAPIPANPVPTSRMFRFLIGAAAVLSVAAWIPFSLSATAGIGWSMYAGSLGLLLLGLAVGFIPARLNAGQRRTSRPQALKWLTLISILVFASAVRVWQLDSMPPGVFYDEALVGLSADRILADPNYHPLYGFNSDRPLHVAYLTAGAFALFGRNITAIRLVTAAFGVLSVLAAYWLFDRLLGRLWHPAGLMGATLVAVMRYDLTFSRIAFDGITVPLCIMASLALLDYGCEHKNIAAFALLGVCVGLGLAFYQPMLIYTLLLVVLGLAAIARAMRPASDHATLGRDRWRQSVYPWLPYASFALLGFWVAASPVAEYAFLVPARFLVRVNKASMLSEVGVSGVANSLWGSVTRQLGMFHAEGDHSGRHNLPGAPLLDPVMAVLVALGTGIAVRRWREPPFLLAWAVLAAMLAAGILSEPSEVPHALRSIGTITVITYFALLAVVGLLRMLALSSADPRPWQRLALGVVPIGLLVASGTANLDTYFNRQMRNDEVQAAHSMADTWIAGEMNRLHNSHDFLIARLFWNHPTIRFLAPEIANSRPLEGDEAVPLKLNATRPLVLFLDPAMGDLLNALRESYPDCVVVYHSPSDVEHSVAYEIVLSVEILRAPHAR